MTKDDVKGYCRKKYYKLRGWWIVRHISSNRYIYITLICIGLPIYFYWRTFGANGVSESTDSWGTFGDYIGGCCSIILAFLALIITGKMEKRDRKDKKREEAVEEIYEQIQKIRGSDYDARYVNKLRRDTERHRLYIPEDLYLSLMKLSDYFLQVRDGVSDEKPDKEEEIILRLKSLYNE